MGTFLTDSIQHYPINHDSDIPDCLRFKLAETKSELEQAFKLVSHCYSERGYIAGSDSKLRIKIHHTLPQAAIFVGKLGDLVVATSSVFPDSVLGLPADAIFQAELDELRSQGRRMAEIGALASNLETGTTPLQVPLHLLQVMRIAYLYGEEHLKVDDLIITVNPKHQFFYEKALLFEVISDVKSYSDVNQAPAIAMRQNFHTIARRLSELSSQKSRLGNLRHLFFHTGIVNLDFLKPNQPINLWNTELLNYFFCQKTSIFQNFSPALLSNLQPQYIQSDINEI